MGCQCLIGGVVHPEFTQPCCAGLHGDFNPTNGDCAASSISEHLSNFRSCCESKAPGLTSDCDFP
ncbi:hypothetical protein FB45DRAFT_741963 [Roridomyces roridus]|uniref:Uncharacterized protein n=1 Tax=Roridomyces roridus TaxID=1738132 RepID=A0AAD7C337_9AGAR|nr:hypothetical protein FB45DRAFT_741963 [Roridomyces roridus]